MTDNILPDGRTVSEVDLARMMEDARARVRDMLETCCIPAGAHARKVIAEAIRAIVAIYVAHATVRKGKVVLDKEGKSQVQMVLSDLRDRLHETIEDYCTAGEDEERRSKVLAYLSLKYAGLTVDERISAGTSLLLGKLGKVLEGETLRNGGIVPSDIADALGDIAGIATLVRLVGTEISRTFNHKWREDAEGAQYVHVFRGSSYNCDICDDIVSLGWQSIAHAVTPPIHPNCRCYCVYI